MKDYTSYTMEDFALDEDFCRWVRENSPSDDIFWRQFLRENEDKAGEVDHARLIVKATKVKEVALTGREIREEVQKFLDAASAQQTSAPERTGTSFRLWSNTFWYAAAAAVLVLIGVYGVNRYRENRIAPLAQHATALTETVNKSRLPMNLTLSDSSRIILQPGSSLRYPQHFGPDERKVYLSGEANFAVTKSKAAFIIISGDMVTKVLGTRFTVRAYDGDKQNRVQVQSGKVSVYPLMQQDAPTRAVKGLILTANQEAVFEKKEKELSKTLVSNPQKIRKTMERAEITYQEVAFSTILQDLGTAYGIPVQFDEQRLRGCRITASFTNESFYEQLDQLCKIASATYEIVDGQIIVTGQGCD